MKVLRISYRIGTEDKTIDYTAGEVAPLVERLLGAEGLSTSTVSLILRLVSTLEELSQHQEQGFVMHSIEWRPDPSKEE